MKKLSFWSSGVAGRVRQDLAGPLWLAPDESGRIVATDVEHAESVQIRPVDAAGPVAAQALVPPAAEGQVARNGLPLSAGAHDLCHADLLELGQEPFWISVDQRPEETLYDVGRHPADAFCFLTRIRLLAGEPIVICPGPPDAPCGAIYRRSAWDTAKESSASFTCANCGFIPGRGEWTPPAPRGGRSLSRLLELVARGGETT